MCHRGTCIRYVHSAPFGGVRWAYAVAPRGFAAQGFALGYGPAGLQPGRVRPIRARGPVGLLVRVPVRPVGAPDHSPGRNPGRAGYVHSAPFGSVWGAYAIRPYTGYVLGRVPGQIRRPPQTPKRPNAQTPQQLNN